MMYSITLRIIKTDRNKSELRRIVHKSENLTLLHLLVLFCDIRYPLSRGRRDKVAVLNNNTQYVAELLTRPFLSNGPAVIVVWRIPRIKQFRQKSVVRIMQFQQISVARIKQLQHISVARIKQLQQISVARIKQLQQISVARIKQLQQISVAKIEQLQ